MIYTVIVLISSMAASIIFLSAGITRVFPVEILLTSDVSPVRVILLTTFTQGNLGRVRSVSLPPCESFLNLSSEGLLCFRPFPFYIFSPSLFLVDLNVRLCSCAELSRSIRRDHCINLIFLYYKHLFLDSRAELKRK